MTIYDISEKAGVSIATVSRVLNGSNNVSAKTKQKVLDVIQQYEYTPNVFARGLGLNTMKTIGLLCPDSSDLYIAKAIYYLEQFLRANGYDSILSCSGYELINQKKSMELLINKKVDGIILVGSMYINEDPKDNLYIKEAAAQVPVMLLNAALDAPNVYSTLSDDFASVYNATMSLINAGVQDILYYHNAYSYCGKRKIAGYKAAIEISGQPFRDDMIQYYSGNREDIPQMAEHLKNIFDTIAPFHGVIAAEDTLALGALKFAVDTGLKVPEDLSIIGYNNSMLVNCCQPPLTSIDNKLEMLCKYLIDTLMKVLSSAEDTPASKTVFSGELIKRGTTV